jgi:hypothetical protein
MKKIALLLLVSVVLTACAAATPVGEGPVSEVSQETEIAKAVEGTIAAELSAAETEIPASTEANNEPAATATDEPAPTNTSTSTLLPEPTETASPTPTVTALAFDPSSEFGGPTILDSFASDSNWVDGNGDLPNSSFLRMALGTSQMLVTGKPASFDTWWFTWPSAADQYLEMRVEVENCDGRQAYGFIVRGPANAADARGYIVNFSCNGEYRLRRLDDLSPYTFEDLVPWTNSDLINAGDDEVNILGIRFIGDIITIFANGEQLDEVVDATYSSGRFGLFVNAGPPGDFTYIINELSFWDLD